MSVAMHVRKSSAREFLTLSASKHVGQNSRVHSCSDEQMAPIHNDNNSATHKDVRRNIVFLFIFSPFVKIK